MPFKVSIIIFDSLKDCGEDLLVDISEVLFNEIAFYRLIKSPKGLVNKSHNETNTLSKIHVHCTCIHVIIIHVCTHCTVYMCTYMYYNNMCAYILLMCDKCSSVSVVACVVYVLLSNVDTIDMSMSKCPD